MGAELRAAVRADRVARDVRSARESGVSATPAFFVNGRRHREAFDAGMLLEALQNSSPAG